MARRLAAAMLVTVVAPTANACAMIGADLVPATVTAAFESAQPQGCTATPDRARRRAATASTDGREISLWVAPTLAGGESAVVIDDDAATGGVLLGPDCPRQPRDDSAIDLLGARGFAFAAHGKHQVVAGRAPLGAAAVNVEFVNSVVTTAVAEHGYFVVVQTTRGNRVHAGRLMAGVSVTALDAAGRVIASA